jgi:acyl-CoA synthetase (AMP-forming)/AMP-acid ligase II
VPPAPAPLPAFATLVEALDAHAAARPRALAYDVEGESISFGQLEHDARHLAAVLASRGVGPGTHVGLFLPTGLAFLRALYGVQLAGGAPVALNHAMPRERAQRLAAIAGCDLILDADAVTDGLRQPAPVRPLPTVGPDDAAFLQLTSGTTGEPRAVVILQRNLIACLRSMCLRLEAKPDDVYVSWMPLHHDFGLVRFVFSPLFVGHPAYLLSPSIFHLRPWLETIGRVGGTITGAPDFAYRIAARTVNPAGIDLRSLRLASSGGEPVRASTIAAFEKRFAVPGIIKPAYGLAEATLGITSCAPDEPVRVDAAGRVSNGRAYPGFEVWIEDENGDRLPPGVPGEIVAQGAAVFAGYFADEASTRERLRGGALHTGDVGVMDEDGYVYPIARKRALIKRAGAAIAPREIEEAADRVAGIRFSAAVGRVRPDGTEEIVVVAEVQPDATGAGEGRRIAASIEEEVARDLGFGPDEVLLVPPRVIPRTANGKIRYDALRELIATGAVTILFSSAAD